MATSLAERDTPVRGLAEHGYTLSHHVTFRADDYGGGTTAFRLLERANLLTSGIGLPLPEVHCDYHGLRIGTQAITRCDVLSKDMAALADLLRRVLVDGEEPENVKEDVITFRGRFPESVL